MEDYRRAKEALDWVSVAKRNCGQPRITWKDSVLRDIEPLDTAWDDVCLNAVYRDEWNEWTARCASHWKN